MASHGTTSLARPRRRMPPHDVFAAAPCLRKRHRGIVAGNGWAFLGNTDPTTPPPMGTTNCEQLTTDTQIAFREQLTMDTQIVEIRQYNAHIDVTTPTESTPDVAMHIFIRFMEGCQEALNPLQLIPRCNSDAAVHVVSKLYATLATIPKHEIESMLTTESRREFRLEDSPTMHSIGFLEIVMAAVFQVAFRDIRMDEIFRSKCNAEHQQYIGAVKMFLCNTIGTQSVSDHICSIQVHHLLWGGEYPAMHVTEVLKTCNRMAACCTRDFALRKDAFDIWQSLCAHVACMEILRLEGMGRDLDHTLIEELKIVLGVDKWLGIETNVDTYEKIVALFISSRSLEILLE
jgi:hypothetical protein